MFQIKICGIRTEDEALAVLDSRADAAGLNFYPRSKRFLPPGRAEAVAAMLAGRLMRVGLFVNAPLEEVCKTFDRLELELVQLHGDEPPEFLSDLRPRPVMRAFRVGAAGLAPVREYLDACAGLDCLPRMILLDSHAPGQFGGTGQVGPWAAIADGAGQGWLPPFILAGGLTPHNVAEAVRTAHPAGVDTASGVEDGTGMKTAQLARAFVAAARAALAAIQER